MAPPELSCSAQDAGVAERPETHPAQVRRAAAAATAAPGRLARARTLLQCKRLDPATAASCARRARKRSASREGGAAAAADRRQCNGKGGRLALRRRRLGTHPQLLAARARVRRQARTSEPVSVTYNAYGCFSALPRVILRRRHPSPQIRRASSSSLSWEMEPQPLTGARYAQGRRRESLCRSLAGRCAPKTAPGVASADATSHSALTRAHRRAIRFGGGQRRGCTLWPLPPHAFPSSGAPVALYCRPSSPPRLLPTASSSCLSFSRTASRPRQPPGCRSAAAAAAAAGRFALRSSRRTPLAVFRAAHERGAPRVRYALPRLP